MRSFEAVPPMNAPLVLDAKLAAQDAPPRLREIAAGLVQPGDAEVQPAPEYDAAAFDAAPPVEGAAEAAPESAGAPVDEEPQP